jgi:hypothetical protein
MFWHTFYGVHINFSGRSTTSPTPARFYYSFRPHEVGGLLTWPAVRHIESQHSNHFCPDPRQTQCDVWQILSWICSYFFNVTNGSLPFWANSRNHSAQYCTPRNKWRSYFKSTPGKARSKLSGLQYLTVFLHPGSIRVKVLLWDLRQHFPHTEALGYHWPRNNMW